MIRGGEGIGSGREHRSSGGLLCGGDQVKLGFGVVIGG
jgi:hypothetical protein